MKTFSLLIKSQEGDKPQSSDPIEETWSGNIVQACLGKEEYPLPLSSKESACVISCGFYTVNMNIDTSDANNSGMLTLDLISAKDIPAADSDGSSDPYVVVLLNGKKIHKTKHQKNSLNPTFGETLTFPVYAKISSTLDIQIWDHNMLRPHTLLGNVDVPLFGLTPGKVDSRAHALDHATSGQVSISILFEPKVLETLERRHNHV